MDTPIGRADTGTSPFIGDPRRTPRGESDYSVSEGDTHGKGRRPVGDVGRISGMATDSNMGEGIRNI